jgi:hypothetical protein
MQHLFVKKSLNPQFLIEMKRTEKKTSFTEYLPYPYIPERKGQRQTKRLPFAITSQIFQEMCRQKQKNINRLNREKEGKKRKREV